MIQVTMNIVRVVIYLLTGEKAGTLLSDKHVKLRESRLAVQKLEILLSKSGYTIFIPNGQG